MFIHFVVDVFKKKFNISFNTAWCRLFGQISVLARSWLLFHVRTMPALTRATILPKLLIFARRIGYVIYHNKLQLCGRTVLPFLNLKLNFDRSHMHFWQHVVFVVWVCAVNFIGLPVCLKKMELLERFCLSYFPAVFNVWKHLRFSSFPCSVY